MILRGIRPEKGKKEFKIQITRESNKNRKQQNAGLRWSIKSKISENLE